METYAVLHKVSGKSQIRYIDADSAGAAAALATQAGLNVISVKAETPAPQPRSTPTATPYISADDLRQAVTSALLDKKVMMPWRRNVTWAVFFGMWLFIIIPALLLAILAAVLMASGQLTAPR